MDIETALMEAQETMIKSEEYLANELKGIRSGRASTALVEFVKVESYGSMSDLRSLASISIPEPGQILIKPFDPSQLQAIIKGIQAAGLGLNPQGEGKAVRVAVPPLSGDRRKQLIASVKQMGEQSKVALRNARRDANKHIDAAGKDKSLALSEDTVKEAKEDVQKLLKKYEDVLDTKIAAKSKELEQV